jgi:hypothetical protein
LHTFFLTCKLENVVTKEVAILCSPSNKVFARKLVGFEPSKELRHEIETVKKLCLSIAHDNIVGILRHGTLPLSHYYYFDLQYNADSPNHTT